MCCINSGVGRSRINDNCVLGVRWGFEKIGASNQRIHTLRVGKLTFNRIVVGKLIKTFRSTETSIMNHSLLEPVLEIVVVFGLLDGRILSILFVRTLVGWRAAWLAYAYLE